jgi:hypothetical protein
MALTVALGRDDHRIEAGGLLAALYLATNLYTGFCIAQRVGLWPKTPLRRRGAR